MTVLTWQVINGVSNLLPADLRVGNPANLNMRYIVYEAPANAHRQATADLNPQGFHVERVRVPPADTVHGWQGLASYAVPQQLEPPPAEGFQAGKMIE